MSAIRGALLREVEAVCRRYKTTTSDLFRELGARNGQTSSEDYELETCPTCGGLRERLKGSALKAMRLRAGLTLSEISRRGRYSISCLSRAENGQRGRISSPKIEELYRRVIEEGETR